MDLSYDAFKNGKAKPSKTSAALSYDTFKANKEKVAATQAERADLISRGEAVSVNPNKAAPSLGGSILRGIAKPTATLLARPVQLVAGLMGSNEEQQTIHSKYLGDIKTSSNAKDVLKDVGRGLETVSNGVGIGALKSVGVNAAKETALQVAKRVAIEGATAGFMQGVGSGVSSGKTGKDLLWDAAKSTAIGGAMGGAIGGIGAKIFGGKGAKTVDEIAAAKAPYKVPNAGVPNEGYIQPTMRLAAPKAPPDWFVGKAGVAKDIRGANKGMKVLSPDQIERNTKVNYEPYTPDSELPVITAKDKKTPAKNEYYANSPLKQIAKENPVVSTKPNITENVSKDVATKGSNTTPFEKTPTIASDKTITPGGVEVPKVQVSAPIKAKQTKVLNDIPKEEFTSKSKTTQIDFYNQDPELATKIALGEAPVPEGISRSALHRLASNDATGEAAVRLAESPAPSVYGQNLAMQNIGDRSNSLVDSIKEVLDARKSTMSKKEFKASSEELKNIIRANAPTRQEFEALIKEIECK